MKELLDYSIPEYTTLASLSLTEVLETSYKQIQIKEDYNNTSNTSLINSKSNTNLYTSFSNNDEIVDNSLSLLPSPNSQLVKSNTNNSAFYLSPSNHR